MAIIGTFINWLIWIPWTYLGFQSLVFKTGRNRFFLLTAFLMPFYSASFGILGFQFSIYKLFPLFLLLIIIKSHTKINKFLLIFASYMIFISLISYIQNYFEGGFEFAIQFGRSPISTFYGPIIQGSLFILTFFQLVMLPKNININHINIISFYIYGCILLVIIGYVQILFYYIGIPWFDYWFLSDAVGRSIDGGLNVHALDRGFYRMSSLGGEPRHFSAILVLAILLQRYLILKRIQVVFISDKFKKIFFILILSAILMSFSASSVLALIIALTILFSLSNYKVFLLLIFTIFGVLFFFSNTLALSTLLWKLSSLEMMIYAAKKDGFALQAIFHNWYYFIFGYGLNMADLAVPDYYLLQETPFGTVNRYLEEEPMAGAISPTSTILQIMLSGGLAGCFLCILFVTNFLKHTSKASKVFFASFVGCLCVSSFLIFGMGLFLAAIIVNMERVEQTANT
jgi:hypothetical protein